MSKRLPKLLVIVGPTASGKTALSIELAKQFNGEVINADSRQFYKGMDIGTAKISKEEMEGIPHHLLDFLNPDEDYNVALYQKDCFKVIEDIQKRGKLPILVGGTGLYISSIIENYQFDSEEPSTGPQLYDYLLIQPTYDRDELYEKINARQLIMMNAGLDEEVQKLSKQYGWETPAMTGIGYRQFKNYFKGDKSREEVISELQQANRNYAKRQITWFNRYVDEIHSVSEISDASKVVSDWLAK